MAHAKARCLSLARAAMPMALLIAIGPAHAPAHVNDRGMDYSRYKDHRGVSCCNKVDCRPAMDYVDTTEHGFPVVRLLIDGNWISVSRYFVVAEDATDGRAHWCGRMLTAYGSLQRVPVPMCVILPPRTT
jgi:hypothetical protein